MVSIIERIFGGNSNDPSNKDSGPKIFSDIPGIQISEKSVSFLGVELERRTGGKFSPDLTRFKDNVLTDFDLRMMQKIAVALELNQPLLIESGSGIGKSETVERMCAMLRWECYYANCHDFEADVLIGSKTIREDTKSGFGWKDGIVMQAIRNGGVLFLDEYNFMRGETRGRLHEVLDSVLRGKKEIVLIENDGEVVKVNPNFRIVAAQNPPAGEYSDREVLDPAQFTRFVYMKEVSNMPPELKEARLLGVLGRKESGSDITSENLVCNKSFSLEKLKVLPNIDLALKQYLEFEDGLSKLIERGNIGESQPQPVFLSFQRDVQRVLGYMSRFYNGDLEDTLKQALRFYYKNKFEEGSDRNKIEELINSSISLKKVVSMRQPLDAEELQKAA